MSGITFHFVRIRIEFQNEPYDAVKINLWNIVLSAFHWPLSKKTI